MSEFIGQHDLLLQSSDRESAEQRARSFFEQNQLIRYDTLHIDSKNIINATDPSFFLRIEQGLAANRQVINELIKELQTENAADSQSWSTLAQGYSTKLLHTLAHLLDGFIGADSAFYNLVDSSHQVSENLLAGISNQKEKFWLIRVIGTTSRINPELRSSSFAGTNG